MNHVLEVNMSSFMSHSIVEFVLASSNKEALVKLGNLFQIIDDEISFRVMPVKARRVYTVQRMDMNFNSITSSFDSPSDKILNDDDYEVSQSELIVHKNITKKMMYDCLLRISDKPVDHIEGRTRKTRAMNNGSYYDNKDKFNFYKGIYIK